MAANSHQYYTEKKKNLLFSWKFSFFLLPEPHLRKIKVVGRPVFHLTFFYQKELEVVGAVHLADNNNSWEEQKQTFSTKNCVVVLSRDMLKLDPIVEEKTVLTVGCVFFFFQAKPRARWGRRRVDCGCFFFS